MQDWTRTKVDELTRRNILVVGDGYRAKNVELSRNGLPFARGANINQGFHLSDAECLDSANLHRAGEKISRPGDVVFTSKGSVGRFAFVNENTPKFVYSPQLCYWRVLNTNFIEPRFLYFWMHGREFLEQSNGVKGQTDMADYVSLVNQRRFHITLPPIEEQKAIARILSSLDDKIELNRRMNATLEAMARALFKAWFVDFEPVHANKENRPSTSASPEIAKLFPSEFENGIPKGWRLGTVADIASISKKLISPKKFPAEEFLHFSLPAFDDGMWPKKEPGASIKSNKFFIEKDSILVSKLNPHIFRAWNSYTSTNSRSIGSTEFIVYEPKRPEYWSLLAALMRSEGMIAEFQQHATGTSNSHQRVKPESTLGFGALVPDAPIAVRFDEIVRPMLRKAQRNIEEVTKLAETRDSLLPRLISGKIRVEGAEMF